MRSMGMTSLKFAAVLCSACLFVVAGFAVAQQQPAPQMERIDAAKNPDEFNSALLKAREAYQGFMKWYDDLQSQNPRTSEIRQERERYKKWYQDELQQRTAKEISYTPEQKDDYRKFKSTLRALTMEKFMLKYLDDPKYRDIAPLLATLMQSKAANRDRFTTFPAQADPKAVAEFRAAAEKKSAETEKKITDYIGKFQFSKETVDATLEKVEAEFVLEVLLDGYLALALPRDYQQKWIAARAAVVSLINRFDNVPADARDEISEMTEQLEKMRQ